MANEFDFQGAFDRVHDRLDRISQATVANQTKLEGLLGNGQPGKIKTIEDDIDELKEWKATSKGWIGAVSAIAAGVGVLGHFLIDAFKAKH